MSDQQNLICPICGKEMHEFNWGWGCQGYNDKSCNFRIGKEICKRKIKEPEARRICEIGDSGLLKGFVSAKTGGNFDMHLIVNKEQQKLEFSFEKKEQTPVESTDGQPILCPLCGKQLVTRKFGWGCPGYSEGCNFSVYRDRNGKKLSDKQMENIIRYGDSGLITGFVSKTSGKTYDAHLILNPDGRITMQFEDRNK